jgi:DNA-binding phage protein
MNETKALKELRRSAERREKADDERHFATAELRKYVHLSRAAGAGVTQIAEAAGLSRQAVYEVLGQDAPPG